MNTNIKVTEIQRFCMHDGPGVRTAVFLKGCPLRCAWCHNPETQRANEELLFYSNKCLHCGACVAVCPTDAHTLDAEHRIDRQACHACASCTEACPTGALELCGKDLSFEEVLAVIEQDRAFYGTRGGVTLSGGEPFLQAHATVELLKACKARGLSTAVETCGYAQARDLLAALPYVDLFLWDVKDTDEERHKQYTGVSNRRILENLRILNEAGARIRLRCILVNGVNTDEAHYSRVARLASTLHHGEGVEWIPYHAYGGTKATFLGNSDNGRCEWIPTEEQMTAAKAATNHKKEIQA